MNYYEELGIRADADEEEIRKAHRRLVKLMHPDQHRDAGLKALAETQMRRLNSVVATLLDPEERREYDEELRGGSGDPSKLGHPQSTWRAVPWWIASTLGAIILTVGTLWFFADRMGPSKRTTAPAEITETTPQVLPKAVDPPAATKQPEETTTVSVPNMPKPVEEKKPTPPPAPPPLVVAEKPVVKPAQTPVLTQVKQPVGVTKATKPPVIAATKETPKAAPAPIKQTPPVVIAKKEDPPPMAPPVVVTPPPQVVKEPTLVATAKPPEPAPASAGDIPKPAPPPIAPVPMKSHDPLEGEWVYAPTEPEKRRAGLYPPEFIQLRLVKDTSGMHGEYSARYNVDRSVSPDVNFVLKATDPTAMKYVWTAANGAHGWMLIRDLETDTMRLEWKDTSKHNGQQLTSGQATLVRKN